MILLIKFDAKASDNIFDLNISYQNGIVSDKYCGDKNKTPIVLIQDLHKDNTVQQNINSILEYISKEQNIDTIFIEGLSGRPEWLFGDFDSEAARLLLNNNTLTGAEYFAITNNMLEKTYGLEDAEIFDDNIKRLAYLSGTAESVSTHLKTIEDVLRRISAKAYCRENKKFAKLKDKYRSGKISQEVFYKEIKKNIIRINKKHLEAGLAVPFSGEFINILKCVDMYAIKIDSKKMQKELNALAANLKSSVSYAQYKNLLDASRDFHDIDKLISMIGDENFINLNGFLLEDYKELSKYSDYIAKNKEIDILALINEEDALSEDIMLYNALNQYEKDLVVINNLFGAYRDYLLNSATENDYKKLTDFGIGNFTAILRKAVISSNYDIAGKFGLIERYADSFYFYNSRNIFRNTVFSNILSEAGNGKNGVKVAVMGGFHTGGVSKSLKEKGIPHIVITPAASSNQKQVRKEYIDSVMDLSDARQIEANAIALPSIINFGKRRQQLHSVMGGLNKAAFEIAANDKAGPDSIFNGFIDQINREWYRRKVDSRIVVVYEEYSKIILMKTDGFAMQVLIQNPVEKTFMNIFTDTFYSIPIRIENIIIKVKAYIRNAFRKIEVLPNYFEPQVQNADARNENSAMIIKYLEHFPSLLRAEIEQYLNSTYRLLQDKDELSPDIGKAQHGIYEILQKYYPVKNVSPVEMSFEGHAYTFLYTVDGYEVRFRYEDKKVYNVINIENFIKNKKYAYIIERVRAAADEGGYDLILQGGMVRDTLLGFDRVNDFDIYMMRKRFGFAFQINNLANIVKKHFPFINFNFHRYEQPSSYLKTDDLIAVNFYLDGQEVSLFNYWGITKESREKDATINGFFYMLSTGDLIDTSNRGFKDIVDNKLSMVDPKRAQGTNSILNVLRYIRLAYQANVEISEETKAIIFNKEWVKSDLDDFIADGRWNENFRMIILLSILTTDSPAEIFEELNQLEILWILLPEAAALNEKDFKRTMDELRLSKNGLNERFAALCSRLKKPQEALKNMPERTDGLVKKRILSSRDKKEVLEMIKDKSYRVNHSESVRNINSKTGTGSAGGILAAI